MRGLWGSVRQVDAELASGALDPFQEEAKSDTAAGDYRLPPGWQVGLSR